jgi:hypothetical protein
LQSFGLHLHLSVELRIISLNPQGVEEWWLVKMEGNNGMKGLTEELKDADALPGWGPENRAGAKEQGATPARQTICKIFDALRFISVWILIVLFCLAVWTGLIFAAKHL